MGHQTPIPTQRPNEGHTGACVGALNTVNSIDKIIASEGEKRENLVRNLIVSNYPLPQQVLQVAKET